MTAKTINIAVSRGDLTGNYPKYQQWIELIEPDIHFIDLYYKNTRKIKSLLSICNGLILTGGNDIHPKIYGKPENELQCNAIDYKRDILEIEMLQYAFDFNLPILAICRGMQLLNVALGGSLLTDIETNYSTNLKHSAQGKDKENCFHTVKIDENSILSAISKNELQNVNSYHHQALDEVSSQLRVTAMTEDFLPEAVEWKVSEKKPFLLGVQWHPERMNNNDIFSLDIAKRFVNAVKYKTFNRNES